MTTALHAGQQGTPLLFLSLAEFPLWLEKQPQNTQNWLKVSQFKQGLQLLPDANNSLVQALFVCANSDDFFTAGDLPNTLPQGDYYLANVSDSAQQLRIAFAWGVGAYRYDRYKKDSNAPAQLYLPNSDLVKQAKHLITATTLVRDLINTPAADMMPGHLASAVGVIAGECGAKVAQIVGDDLLQQNYPMIHAVGRASEHKPRLIDMRWGKEGQPKITLVGKGICFDSGGLDIKPSSGMRTMKKDMGGAAHVLGLAYLIMTAQLPVQLCVLIPAAENAISSNSFRPGDVIKTRKGLTVEIDNTDAEGRLVLCDALAEAVTEKPDLIIDFATLTGAQRVALGTDLPGFFTNQKDLTAALMNAGEKVSDPVWPLPLFQAYKDELKSDVADLVNSASSPYGGAITAALYLEHFIDELPWLHFDMMAWNRKKTTGKPVGGEAMGVRAVFEYLRERYGN
ncbi:MAG: hypothetical protein RL217_1677 [Pseudomonadota bacterium]|jgi:leucyl aminopeptidase